MHYIDLKTQHTALRARIEARMRAVMEHGSYIMGPEVDELEEQLASYVGVQHAVSMSSGTDALVAALFALEIGSGDEVITSPFSFFATAEAISLVGARPVFTDIDPRTYNMDPARVASAITSRTRAIVPVSLFGQPADMDAINVVASAHGLPVIEDAAQSFGAKHKGRCSGALSTIACTSFYPSKPLGCYGDGGACFTDDAALARRLRQIREHGQDAHHRHLSVGLNGRLDTLQAAVLLVKLEILPAEIAARERLGRGYTELFRAAKTPVETPFIEAQNTSVYAQYTVAAADRDGVRTHLHNTGVPTAVHYPAPVHLQPAMSGLGHRRGDYPVAERAAQRVLSLPMHPYLDEQAQARVVAAVHEATTVASVIG